MTKPGWRDSFSKSSGKTSAILATRRGGPGPSTLAAGRSVTDDRPSRTMRTLPHLTETWDALSTSRGPTSRFDPAAAITLPVPALRLLTRSVRPGTPLARPVLIDMEGEIRLKKWMPFRARQILAPARGFVWEATVGTAPVVFGGGDSYHQGEGRLDFRLWGLIPVAQASGPDISRSATGRLAAETVAWAPHALTDPVRWRAVDDTHAVATIPAEDHETDVTVTVDAEGLVRELSTRRWGNPDSGDFDWHPFGGRVDSHAEYDGVTVAAAGVVGWHWGTDRQTEGEFFRYRIVSASLLP